ncbi:MAG: hypothetical protein Q9190_006009 [Brigantiaea leucoxantha]
MSRFSIAHSVLTRIPFFALVASSSEFITGKDGVAQSTSETPTYAPFVTFERASMTSAPMVSQTDPTSIALITPFHPPKQCANSLTILAARSYEIWWNEPLPVPAETYTDCYASEFIESYTKSFSGEVLPAFSPIVCQFNYATVLSTIVEGDTYVACCPTGFTFNSPAVPTITRPARGGKCYSGISSTVVNVYGTIGFVSTTTLRETGGRLEAFAPLMDGFAMVGATSPGSDEAAAVTTSSGGEVSGTPINQQTVTQLENQTGTANTASQARSSGSSLTKGDKIGVSVAGAIVGIGAAAAVIVVILQKYKHRNREHSDGKSSGTSMVVRKGSFRTVGSWLRSSGRPTQDPNNGYDLELRTMQGS